MNKIVHYLALHVHKETVRPHPLAHDQFNQPYNPNVWAAAEGKLKKKKINRLQQSAAALGFKLLSST